MNMRTMRKWIYIVPVLALALGLTASCKDADGGNDASGTFEATEVTVSAEASGRIMSLEVYEGGMLAAGQVCGLVDTVQLYLQKRQLEAGVDAALSRKRDAATQTAYTPPTPSSSTTSTRPSGCLRLNWRLRRPISPRTMLWPRLRPLPTGHRLPRWTSLSGAAG